jgi:hypothetical protein
MVRVLDYGENMGGHNYRQHQYQLVRTRGKKLGVGLRQGRQVEDNSSNYSAQQHSNSNNNSSLRATP